MTVRADLRQFARPIFYFRFSRVIGVKLYTRALFQNQTLTHFRDWNSRMDGIGQSLLLMQAGTSGRLGLVLLFMAVVFIVPFLLGGGNRTTASP